MKHFSEKTALGLGNYKLITDKIISSYDKNKQYKFAELGCASGGSISHAIVELLNHDFKFHYYAIDSWNGSDIGLDLYWEQCKDKCRERDMHFEFVKFLTENGIIEYVTPIRMKTDFAYKLFDDEYFDFVYVDAEHQYKYVLEDLINWYPKVKSGMIMGGDDFHMKGVGRAVTEFFGEKNIEINENYGTWYVIKEDSKTLTNSLWSKEINGRL